MATTETAVPVTPELRRVLDAWSPRPAYVRDRQWDFLAINDAAREVFGYGDTDHNCLVSFFTNIRYRSMNTQWAESAPGVVARFRADAARYPGDPGFGRLAEDLRAASPEFAELWERHDVSGGDQAVKAVRHPDAGELTFEATLLPLQDRPGQSLVLHNPRPGTDTQARLEQLMTRVRLARAS